MVKTPWLVRRIFNNVVWKIPTREKILYLTFDDGPHPVATPFVLEQLETFNAKATFFCLGKNVLTQPKLYREILDAEHAVGNHTFNHLNGWKAKDQDYIDDVIEARKHIDSSLFRPPYGKITSFQAQQLSRVPFDFTIVMWDVLSKDYNPKLNGEQCAFNVVRHAEPGSVVVFHDSEKAFPRLQKALPAVLKFFSEKEWRFEAINRNDGKKTKS